MSIKSIDQKFASANSVPVERAVVTREEWEAVATDNEALRVERDLLDQMNQDLESTCQRLLKACKTAKAQGAQEVLQRAMQTPGFSDTVVMVADLEAAIADMESENE